MFISIEKLTQAVKDALHSVLSADEDNTIKVNALKDQIAKLKTELEDLKLKKRIELEEIQHLVKIEREKNKLDLEKSEINMQGEFKNKEMKLQTEYFQKHIALMREGQESLQKVHEEILKRLPNVNMTIEHGSK